MLFFKKHTERWLTVNFSENSAKLTVKRCFFSVFSNFIVSKIGIHRHHKISFLEFIEVKNQCYRFSYALQLSLIKFFITLLGTRRKITYEFQKSHPHTGGF